MPSFSPNINLKLYDRTADKPEYFIDYRDSIAGTGATSDMMIIDDYIGGILNDIESIKGTGYTDETIYDNAQAILALKQKGIYVTSVSGTNTLTATIADLATIPDNLAVIIRPLFANTATVTLNINGTGAKPITKVRNISGSTTYDILEAGDLQPYKPILLVLSSDGVRYIAENFGETFARNVFYDNGDTTFTSVQDKIADIEQVIGAYGVKWNETDDVWTRLGQATSTTNWDNVFPYSNIRRCNVADNGTVLAYYGDPNYIEDGTNGQVMVEYPKYYSKYLYYTIGGKTYHEWWVSGTNYTGMEVDPMFRKGDSYTEYTYVSAYEGSIYDVSASAYLLADEQIADFTATTGDKLSSIAGAKPCSGLTQDLTIVKSRILANNRGNGWGLMNGLQVAGIQHLFMIEYGHANSQTAIGLGVVNKASGTVNEPNITGATSFLGNSSGREAGTDGLTSVSYRGLENLWGNIWSWVDGINIKADNKLWMNLKNENFVSDSFVEPYYELGTLSNVNGYVSKLLGSKYGMFATQSTGSSSTRIPDYYYQSTGNRVARLGGFWNLGSTAGFAYWNFSSPVSYRDRSVGARCAFFN